MPRLALNRKDTSGRPVAVEAAADRRFHQSIQPVPASKRFHCGGIVAIGRTSGAVRLT
jgi:hypothetical protein